MYASTASRAIRRRSSRGGRTERVEKPSPDQCPCWFPVASAIPRYFCKVRRLPSPKAIQNQTLTSSVLIPRSREVWRQTARERELRVPCGAPQSEGFRAEPMVIGLLCALEAGRECCLQQDWRRERDSNPRYGFPYTRFPSERLQPLGHPSCSGAGVPRIGRARTTRRRPAQYSRTDCLNKGIAGSFRDFWARPDFHARSGTWARPMTLLRPRSGAAALRPRGEPTGKT